MAKPIKQIVLSPEQTAEMLERIAELAHAEQDARNLLREAEANCTTATRTFLAEAGLAASLGVVHQLYPPRSDP